MGLTTLKKRAEFLRLRGGGRSATEAFVLEGRKRVAGRAAECALEGFQDAAAAAPRPDEARFGFTVTRKIGNAVVRNRIRRRLKMAVGDVAEGAARDDCDYVLVARRAALERNFSDLKGDLVKAFARVNAIIEGAKTRRK